MKFYLKPTDLQSLARDLSVGLSRLTLAENFESFDWQGEIAAGEEVTIDNRILGNSGMRIIPSEMIVTYLSGPPTIRRGDTEWSDSTLTLKNVASESSVSAIVRFLR